MYNTLYLNLFKRFRPSNCDTVWKICVYNYLHVSTEFAKQFVVVEALALIRNDSRHRWRRRRGRSTWTNDGDRQNSSKPVTATAAPSSGISQTNAQNGAQWLTNACSKRNRFCRRRHVLDGCVQLAATIGR